jgi:hypothetical protein
MDPSDPVGPTLLAEADAALPPDDSALRVAVLGARGTWLAESPERAVMLRPAEQALAMARRLGQPYAVFRALLNYQFALHGAPRPEDRLSLADEAVELAQSIGNRTLVTAALGRKMMPLLALGRVSEVVDLFHECARLDPASTSEFRVGFEVVWAAIEGRMNDWEQLARRFRARREGTSGRIAHLISSTNTLFVAWLQGRDEFPALLERRKAEFGDFHEGLPVETCLAAAAGRLDQAREILNGPEREPWRRCAATTQHLWAGFCASLVAALGDHDQIAALYDDLIDNSGTWLLVGTNNYFGAADHHLGVLARALGRPDEADERLRAAMASYDAGPERLFRAAALVELAELAAERYDKQRCRDLLAVAEPEARQMGLEPLLTRCARLQS